jgi:hypothetical protein
MAEAAHCREVAAKILVARQSIFEKTGEGRQMA